MYAVRARRFGVIKSVTGASVLRPCAISAPWPVSWGMGPQARAVCPPHRQWSSCGSPALPARQVGGRSPEIFAAMVRLRPLVFGLPECVVCMLEPGVQALCTFCRHASQAYVGSPERVQAGNWRIGEFCRSLWARCREFSSEVSGCNSTNASLPNPDTWSVYRMACAIRSA